MSLHVITSHHVGVTAKYLGPTDTRGGRIKVKRADHTVGDHTLTVGWDHSLDLANNYAAAIMQFLSERIAQSGDSWAGDWVIGATTDGYQAVKIPKDYAHQETDAPT